MKLKTALTLSLMVNAIFLAAVGYMNATEIKPSTTRTDTLILSC